MNLTFEKRKKHFPNTDQDSLLAILKQTFNRNV